MTNRDVAGGECGSPKEKMAAAARALLADYEADEELTVFTALDGEDTTSNNIRFEDVLKRWMQDPEFVAEYEALEPAYQAARLRIQEEVAGRKAPLTTISAHTLLTTEWPESSYEEMQFRKGYYYAVDDVLTALGRGITARQLRPWLEGELFDWWQGDITKYKKPPIIP